MLLQPITLQTHPNYPHQNHIHFYSSNALSFSSGLLRNSAFFLKQPIISTTSYKTRNKNPIFVTCSSVLQPYSSGTVDYEKKRSMLEWSDIYKKIIVFRKSTTGPASVLNQVENEGKRITKWELTRIVKELRKNKRYKFALEVHEWMNNKPERFRLITSDTAIRLDLISKVHGISSAEQYFRELPDTLKDGKIYCSLLNAYVHAKMSEEAEFLMDKMRKKNYANCRLPFNVMMTLYLKLKDQKKIESLVSEMTEKNIAFDCYTYHIWLSSRGPQGSIEEMEQVFQQMELDKTVQPNWTIFSMMATAYIKSGHLEKADACLRKIEGRVPAHDRAPYHYLISLYGTLGKKEDVHRIWNIYRASFVNIQNVGYYTMISALSRVDDIEEAERVYDEWLSVRSLFDPRIGNLLLRAYVRKGLSEKAKTFFAQMIEIGGEPISATWEIIAVDHIRNMRISDALSCFKTAALADSAKSWKPKPVNVRSMLEIIEKEDDVASKNALLEILRQVGCFDDPGYMSCIPLSAGGTYTSGGVSNVEDRVDGDEGDSGIFAFPGQLPEGL